MKYNPIGYTIQFFMNEATECVFVLEWGRGYKTSKQKHKFSHARVQLLKKDKTINKLTLQYSRQYW